MNMFRLTMVLAITMCTIGLIGCTSKPPGCGAEETISLSEQTVLDAARSKTVAAFNQSRAQSPGGQSQASITTIAQIPQVDGGNAIRQFYENTKLRWNAVVSDGYVSDAKKFRCKGTLVVTTGTGQVVEQQTSFSTQKTESKDKSFVLEIEQLDQIANAVSKLADQAAQASKPATPPASSVTATPAAHPLVGSYSGPGEGMIELKIKPPLADGTFPVDISTVVPMTDGRPGCGGGTSGIGVLQDSVMTITATAEDKKCEITARITPDQVLLEEGKGCTYFHGAACGFSGTVTKVKQ